MTQSAESELASCSFCGKSQHEVRSLIEGGCSREPGAHKRCVFICDECVDSCAQVLAEAAGHGKVVHKH